MYIPDLTDAFVDGRKVSTKNYEATLKLQGVGKLFLPTGRIIAADPLVVPEQEPFTVSVEAGSYPVVLSVAEFDTDQRVAYAMLRFNESPAVRWELALTADQDVNTLEPDQFFGYGVDSGTGCFMDAQVGAFLSGIGFDESEKLFDDLVREMDKTYISTWSYLNTIIVPETGANLIAFSTGWGDGAYASYFGYDARNNLVNLITDFGIFYEESED